MISLYEYIVGLCGVFLISDGIGSIWAYLKDPNQTWGRDHSLRILRMLIGVLLTILVFIL